MTRRDVFLGFAAGLTAGVVGMFVCATGALPRAMAEAKDVEQQPPAPAPAQPFRYQEQKAAERREEQIVSWLGADEPGV